jgi:hypothetical protein
MLMDMHACSADDGRGNGGTPGLIPHQYSTPSAPEAALGPCKQPVAYDPPLQTASSSSHDLHSFRLSPHSALIFSSTLMSFVTMVVLAS